MDLTPENQAAINKKGIGQLLAYIKFSPPGDDWMRGDTGIYWLGRVRDYRDANPEAFWEAARIIGCCGPQDFSNN